MRIRMFLGLLMAFSFAGCQKPESVPVASAPPKVTNNQASAPQPLPPVDPAKATYRILFFGNSHTLSNDIPGLIARMIGTDGSGELAYVKFAGGGYVDEAWQNPNVPKLIQDGNWTHVVLQAVRYSVSGRFNYSTKEAVAMAQHIEKCGAKPVFFPEWGQAGNNKEGRMVHDLHCSIVKDAGVGTVSPVGLAWDRALAEKLTVVLHSTDGNHAAIHGGFLTAAVLYATITGREPQGINNSVMPNFVGPDRDTLLAAAQATIDEQRQNQSDKAESNTEGQ